MNRIDKFYFGVLIAVFLVLVGMMVLEVMVPPPPIPASSMVISTPVSKPNTEFFWYQYLYKINHP